jgi:hypothetical protein
MPSIKCTCRARLRCINAGWTAGGGVEVHLGGHWTGKIEYLYMDFGSVNANSTNQQNMTLTTQFNSHITDQLVRCQDNNVANFRTSRAARQAPNRRASGRARKRSRSGRGIAYPCTESPQRTRHPRASCAANLALIQRLRHPCKAPPGARGRPSPRRALATQRRVETSRF